MKQLIKLYEKGQSDFSSLLFETQCTEKNNKKHGSEGAGIIVIRDKDIKYKLYKNDLKIMKLWLEKCNDYLIHLSFPNMYILFHYDTLRARKDKNKRQEDENELKRATLMQLFSQIKKNKNNKTSLSELYGIIVKKENKISVHLNKAISKYWKDLNKIIKNAPQIPENCPIIVYRGSKSKNEKIQNKPFSASLNINTAKLYQDPYLYIFKMQKGGTLLPLFYFDPFSYENEVLMSSDCHYTLCHENEKRKEIYFDVSCN